MRPVSNSCVRWISTSHALEPEQGREILRRYSDDFRGRPSKKVILYDHPGGVLAPGQSGVKPSALECGGVIKTFRGGLKSPLTNDVSHGRQRI